MNDTLCTLRCFPTQVCLECVLKEPSHGMSTGSLSLSVSFKLPSSAAWVPVLSLRQPANAIDSKGFPYGRCQNRLSSSSLSAPAVHKQCALLSLSVAVGSCGRILSRQCTQSDSKSERTGRTKLGPPTRSADRLEQLEASLQRLKTHAAGKGGGCLAKVYVNSQTKVEWECSHGHRWHATPRSVLNAASWCPSCARAKRRVSLQRLQNHATMRGGKCLSAEVRNVNEKLRWQCQMGHTWSATAHNVLHMKTWCPDCSSTGPVRQKRGLQDLHRHAGSRGGRCLATRFSTVMVKVPWQCSKGHVWQATPDCVLNRRTWCPICGGTAPVGLEPLRRHAANLGGECLATEYKNCLLKLRWRCRSGHEWLATANSVRQGTWCPECRDASRRIGLARLQAHAASLGGKCLAKTYKNNKQKLLWECKERHRWKTTAAHVLVHNSWCPHCVAWRTETEVRNIFEFLLNPAKFLSSRPKFLGGLELDGYCEEMSLAFEYQGEQHYDPDNYFHFGSPSSFRMQQDRDARKRELCEDFGVRLVVVPFFAKDKRTFVITSLLQWFSIGEILPKTMAAGKKARRSSDGTSTKHISIQEGPAIFFKSPSRQLCLHN